MAGRPEQDSERDALWIGVLGALALCLQAAPDVGYGDAGELGTAAVVLGVAHPTGFALDLLWLKAASLVPLGPLAFRLNVASALAGGAALGLCAAVIGALAQRLGVLDQRARRLGVWLGVTGLYGLGAFVAATRALEVYALALAAVLLALYVAIGAGRAAGLLALIAGLAVGMHVTAGLYAAPILVAHVWVSSRRLRFIVTHAPLTIAGALVASYLPLASLRDPPLDWGDPETLGGLLAHLTAQRIRNAFQGEMFGGNQSAHALLAEQLSVFAPLAVIAVGALSLVLAGARQRVEPARESSQVWSARGLVLGVAAIGCMDIVYALFVNPMGVRDLQCGHVAGACIAILGGTATACAIDKLEGRALRLAVQAAVVVASLVHVLPRPDVTDADGYALGELFGSGGAVASLPPRTVFLCNGDNACAASMFALTVERVRPDVDFAPAQHLWDATVLRQIESRGALVRAASSEHDRRTRALTNTRALIQGASRRPIALETRKMATEVAPRTLLAPLGDTPFLTPVDAITADAFARSRAALKRALHSRFAGGPSAGVGAGTQLATPHDEQARHSWSRVYGELGAAAIGSPALPDGIELLQTAVKIAPERATAWINLGVALETAGQLDAAVEVTQRALTLDPARAVGWVSLARLEHKRGNLAAAREVLSLAARSGVRDPRLQAIAAQLQ